MELTSPHKHILKKCTCGTILGENTLEPGRRTLIQTKLQERSPRNQVGKKKKKISEWGQIPWEGSIKERGSTWAGSGPGEPPCLLGGPVGQIEGLGCMLACSQSV